MQIGDIESFAIPSKIIIILSMITLTPKTEPAINRGIKTVAIGKKGSKPLDPQLITEIINELKTQSVAAVQQGAFFGALIMKGITAEEKQLEEVLVPGALSNPQKLVECLAADAPSLIKDYCVTILQGKELTISQAEQMGDFLFSNAPGDGARGIFASVLRVRYESPDEYEGLLRSMQKTIEPPFRQPVPDGDPTIQIAEPFDGIDHSFMITPLLADHLQKNKYRVVSLVGRNSGPKFCLNLLDLAKALNSKIIKGNQELKNTKPSLGWYINQENLSSAVDRWVDLRRLIIKRPFLATLERFVNPVGAKIIVASAFHPPYGEKMITICERNGFPGAIIVRNGMEGTVAFALKRAVKILCSAKQADGSYKRHEFEFEPEKFLNETVPTEEKLENPSLGENARLIQEYLQNGQSGNKLFDLRVKTTCGGIDQAVTWLEENIAYKEPK